MRHTKRISPARWAFALAVIGLWSALMLALARVDVLAALAGVAFTVPLCSLGEWLVHGVLYHNRFRGLERIHKIHHAGHHFALFPPERYVQSGPYEFMRVRGPLLPFRMSDNAVDNFLTKWSQIALHFVAGIPLILVPAWFLSGGSVAFCAGALGTLTLISWLLGYVHGVIHTPGDRLIEHMGWFQWLDRHHYIHHIDMESNINFGLPLVDVLLGTHRMTLTDAERLAHPSFEKSKPMAKDIVRRPPARTPSEVAA